MQKGDKKRIGAIGEGAVSNHLRRAGFQIIERNYLKKWGEIDVIAKKDGIVHFVEVKTVSRGNYTQGSSSVSYGTGVYRPEDNVHRDKLRRLHRAVQTWIADRDYEGEWQIDVATVTLDVEGRSGTMRMIENVILE